jgi:hypothetical protein
MSNKREYPDRYGWWKNELASLGITTIRKRHELNDVKELRDLTENIKQIFIEDYINHYKAI